MESQNKLKRKRYINIELNKIYNEDCLIGMQRIPDKSIDMILCDLPYGTTACKWDVIIPFEPLWEQYSRLIKDNGAIVLFGSQPFTSELIHSNIKLFKYAWIWEKERPSNFFAAKFQPLNNTEDILVFGKGGCNNGTKNPLKYYPQGIQTIDRVAKNSNTGGKIGQEHNTTLNDGRLYHQTTTGYPKKTIKFNNDDTKTIHPTQKPVELCEYLIQTYTNENETILDNCMGSGTTAVACINTNRNYIGFETDITYFNLSNERIAKTINKSA